MIVAQSTLGLPSSGISFITCSTCSVGKRPHRWKCSWARDSDEDGPERLGMGRDPTGPRFLFGDGGGVSSLGGEEGGPAAGHHMGEPSFHMGEPNSGEKSRYFHVSELENGSEESARFTDENPRFSWVSDVELSRCIGEWSGGATVVFLATSSSGGGGLRPPWLRPSGWRRLCAEANGWWEPH